MFFRITVLIFFIIFVFLINVSIYSKYSAGFTTTIRNGPFSVSSHSVSTPVITRCPPSTNATSGGYSLAPGYTLSRGQSLAPAVSFSIPPPPPLSPLESFPSVIPTSPNSVNHYTPNGWNITMYNSNANTQQFYSYVICTK